MSYFKEQEYKGIDYSTEKFEKGEYENCAFINCNFTALDLSNINFIECTFENCNLSNVELKNTQFQSVLFIDCKLMGLFFSSCNKLMLDISFKSFVIQIYEKFIVFVHI